MDIQQLDAIWMNLDSSFSTWKEHYEDVSKAFDPGRQRFQASNTNKKRNFNNSIIDPTVTMAPRTLAAGMMAGVTNPSVPWVKLMTRDEDMNKNHNVAVWLDKVSKIIMATLHRSNFYDAVPMVYQDLGMYSIANMLIESDPESVIRFYHKPIGSYRVCNNGRREIDTWATEYNMSANQIVDNYGYDNAPPKVQSAYDSKDYKASFKIRHLIMPRKQYDSTKEDAKNMPYQSVRWVCGEQKPLKVSGFREFPVVTPRWEALGNDSYGSFAPGMLALGTARGLQKDQMQRYEAQDKMINPPLNVPASLRRDRVSLVPGGVNYTNTNEKIESVFNINYPIQYALESISDSRQMIRQAFFNDLFLMITNINKSNVTATEIAERQQEKLLMLGPVLSRINEEFLDPIIERTFNELLRRNMLPEVPEELEGVDIRPEYTSMLYQAQKMVGITSIERGVSFIGNLAGVKPEALDKLNVDAVIDEYVHIIGANPQMLNNEEAVMQIRQARQQQQQAQQMGEMAQPMQQAASAAKLLSETDAGGTSALDIMRANLGG